MNFIKSILLLAFGLSLINLENAHAGDGATILFKEGQVAYIANGYQQLVDEYKKLGSDNKTHKIIQLNLESSPFLINIAEIVIICRDRCSSLEVFDPRRNRGK